MNDSTPQLCIEDLLAEAGWVTALVHTLVRDAADAAAAGRPQPKVMVFARSARGELVTDGFTDARGSFTLRLPPGALVDFAVVREGPRAIVRRGARAGITRGGGLSDVRR